jgi:hypothetical protein
MSATDDDLGIWGSFFDFFYICFRNLIAWCQHCYSNNIIVFAPSRIKKEFHHPIPYLNFMPVLFQHPGQVRQAQRFRDGSELRHLAVSLIGPIWGVNKQDFHHKTNPGCGLFSEP